jgi:hypothetical protein
VVEAGICRQAHSGVEQGRRREVGEGPDRRARLSAAG